LAITKLDVLSGFEEIMLCRSYRLDGQTIEKFPLAAELLERCEPDYETVAGWHEQISGVRDVHELPRRVMDFIQLIEKDVNVPITIVSVGPEPEATMMRS
jgi:adenylosuccinate synthase